MYVHSRTHTYLWLHVCVYLVEDQFAAASAQLCAVLMAVCMYKCVFVCVCVRSSYYKHTHNNVIYNNLLPLCSPLATHAFYTFIYFIVFFFFITCSWHIALPCAAHLFGGGSSNSDRGIVIALTSVVC